MTGSGWWTRAGDEAPAAASELRGWQRAESRHWRRGENGPCNLGKRRGEGEEAGHGRGGGALPLSLTPSDQPARPGSGDGWTEKRKEEK